MTPEPRTEAGRKMLYDMGLDDPIVGKGRHAYAVKRIAAIESEAYREGFDAALGEASERVRVLPVHYRRNGFASATAWVTRRDVLRIIEGGKP